MVLSDSVTVKIGGRRFCRLTSRGLEQKGEQDTQQKDLKGLGRRHGKLSPFFFAKKETKTSLPEDRPDDRQTVNLRVNFT